MGLTVLSGEERLDRMAQAGTMAPLARACTGMLRALPPRKFTAPLDMASAALTVSLSTRRSTVTCCSDFLAGCFRAAAALGTSHSETLRYTSMLVPDRSWASALRCSLLQYPES